MNQKTSRVIILGPTGHGKTTAAVSYFLACHGWNRLRPDQPHLQLLEGRFREQIGRVVRQGVPHKSGPEEIETARFVDPRSGIEVEVICLPGEALRGKDGSVDLAALRRTYCGFADDVLAVVLNPFSVNADLGHSAWLGLTSMLQRDELGYPFQEALAYSAELLFGLDKNEVAKLRNYRTIQRIRSAKLVWNPYAASDEETFFFEELESGAGRHAVDAKRAFQAIRRMAETLADCELDLPAVREIVAAHERSLVCLSRADLLPLLPNLNAGDLDRVFDEAFGGTERHLSQQIKMVNHRIVIEPHDADSEETPIYYDGLLPEGGETLREAVNQRAGWESHGPARPAASGPDETLRWAPALAFAMVLAGSLILSGIGALTGLVTWALFSGAAFIVNDAIWHARRPNPSLADLVRQSQEPKPALAAPPPRPSAAEMRANAAPPSRNGKAKAVVG